MPKISIITPTYNSSKFIKRTIKSVLNQTYKDWEYLIIDDGSTDNTVELVNEFTKQDPRIKLFKTPQNSGGPATPKNIGIENARGEYVAFLDHDDEWLPEKLEKQLKVFEESKNEKIGLVCCFINIVDDKTGKTTSRHKNFNKTNTLKLLVQYNFFLTSSCIMVKKSIINKIGGFDNNFQVSDDWDMWLRILKSGYEFDFAPEYLINYFVHENNLSNDSNIEQQFKEFNLMISKNKDSQLKIKESWFLGYYYFIKKDYKLSRKYNIQNLFSSELGFFVHLKNLAYIILTFMPGQEEMFKKIWRKLK